MDNTKFRTTYGIEKDLLKSKKIVLHCLKGKRAFDAADKLALLGYDDVYVYKVIQFFLFKNFLKHFSYFFYILKYIPISKTLTSFEF